MKIVVAGGSGLLGSALVPALRARGHDVLRLVRHTPAAADEVFWNPAENKLDPTRLEGVDAIVNLCGENVGAGRWTDARRERILRSRVEATRALVLALDTLMAKPSVFVNASAIGVYGNRGEEEMTEASSIGHGFLPEVCLAWETHAEGAARRGVRTALLRFGVVLTREGGALAKMLPLFRLGLGGRLGDGRQWMSWVSLEDAVAAILHALTNKECRGPINVTAPEPVTNTEFTATLAQVLNRPAALHVPAWVLRLVLGRGMADEMLLASTRAIPARLHEASFQFRHATLEGALHASMSTPGG